MEGECFIGSGGMGASVYEPSLLITRRIGHWKKLDRAAFRSALQAEPLFNDVEAFSSSTATDLILFVWACDVKTHSFLSTTAAYSSISTTSALAMVQCRLQGASMAGTTLGASLSENAYTIGPGRLGPIRRENACSLP